MNRSFAAVGIVTAIAVAAMLTMSPKAPAPAPAAEQGPASRPQPVTAQAARRLIASGAILADVREPEELAATGKLKGALNVPLTQLRQLAAHGATPAELEAAKQRPEILYCRTGRRSREAGAILLSQGFRQVYNLGGFEDAMKAGLPAA